jgi:large subunit ribosomal protein L22
MPQPTRTNERPGTRAELHHVIVSPYKIREVLDLIRGLEVGRAQDVLQFCGRGSAPIVSKLLHSAVANAEHNDGLDPTELYVASCFADEARTLKRWRARARGRYTRIRKRTSHVTIIVARLPEDRLLKVRARQQQEVAARRARRVAGGRKARRPDTDAPGTEAPVVEDTPIVEEAVIEEQGIVDPQAAAVEVVEEAAAEEAPEPEVTAESREEARDPADSSEDTPEVTAESREEARDPADSSPEEEG